MGSSSPGSRADATTCPHCDASVEPSTSCRSCGRALAVCGGFRLGEELDRGGVARIFAASSDDGRSAAVKLMERTPLNPWPVHQLFARSARLLSGLSHVGLPRVLGFEKSPRRSFLAMERLCGGTLYRRVADGGKLDGAAVDALLRALLESAAYLHARGLVHGDITPRNVMFRSADDVRPVLVDFDGLCGHDEPGVASLVMTPGYTAPEQRAGTVSVASDLYGIGATLVFAATGRAPDQLSRIGARLEVDLDGATLWPRTRRVLQRLVALEPAHRPTSAQAAITSLEPSPVRLRSLGTRLLVAALFVFLVCALAACAMVMVSPSS